MTPRLIAGLGNPGQQYHLTRHNAGFWFMDALLERYSGQLTPHSRAKANVGKITIAGEEVLLICPETFMNLSGQAVGHFLRYYRLSAEDLLVVHDELDLPLGSARFKTGGGHGGHNGLRSLHQHLGSDRYHRLRIGIGRPAHASEVVSYVLSKATNQQRTLIDTAIDHALDALELWFKQDFEKAKTQLHSVC
jgi:PTH1 family peptidyl-tRNA hydrolase